MKFTSQLFVAGLAPLAHAFPAMMYEAAAADPQLEARAKELAKMLEARQAGADAATALFEPINTFDAKKQFIDVRPGSGHEYVPPGSGDLRGPCPGLNAFANHSKHRHTLLLMLAK
jgi:hypothetical protein